MPDIWIMLLTNYFFPIEMAIVGIYLRLFTPKFRGGKYGFYTARSQESEEKWIFAQKSYYKKSFLLGVGLLVVVVLDNQIPIGQTTLNVINLILGFGAYTACHILVENELKKMPSHPEK